MNSYKAITIIASITNCNIDLIGVVIVLILPLPSLVIQNHDNTDAIIRYVTSFGDPWNGNSVLDNTSPIINLCVFRYSSALT